MLGTLPGGTVGIRSGALFSAAASIEITLHGKGSHGSMPNLGVDPIVLGAAIVTRLQTIVAREISPRQTAVVTVGSFHAGTKSNIIPDAAVLQLNTRAFDKDVEKHLHEAIERIVRKECEAARSPKEPELLLMATHTLQWQYTILAIVAYSLFGLGLAFYATPSTDAALTNLPGDQAGAGSGIYKMASSLGAAFGVAASAAIFTALAESGFEAVGMAIEFTGRQDNLAVREAGMVGLAFNALMAIAALVSIVIFIPKQAKGEAVSAEF